MPSIIKFSGHRDDSLLVNESVEEVADLLRDAPGGVVQLTRNIGTPVFVNAERVAYWVSKGAQPSDSVRTLMARHLTPVAPAAAADAPAADAK